MLKWSIFVTTVKERKNTTLPKTLACLEAAGFPSPRLFIDDSYEDFGPSTGSLSATYRTPRVRAYGNWLLALVETVIRNPLADYYMGCQDDMLCGKNLRPYLEKCRYPNRGYWNLYTTPVNLVKIPPSNKPGQEGKPAVGWFLSTQQGRGAVGLVFSQDIAYKFLGSPHTYTRMRNLQRGWQAIDGGVVESLAHQGIQEWIHYPTLVQHQEGESAMYLDSLKQPEFAVHNVAQPSGVDFKGCDFDMMELLPLKVTP